MLRHLIVALAAAVPACASPAPAPLVHEAYVWPRSWSPAVADAVAHAPAGIGALHVLVEERSGPTRAHFAVDADLDALRESGREVVLVLRVDGTAPLDDVSLTVLADTARAWRARGVKVRGVEVDHDCTTRALAAYARWLVRERPHLGALQLGITALPTWVTSPELGALRRAVDGLVLQVHAVRAPVLFDPVQARRDVEVWARASEAPFFVALPTYRVRLASGVHADIEPVILSDFLRELSVRPVRGLTGVAWFRLGNALDADALGASTLAALVRGDAAVPVAVALRPTPEGAQDILLVSTGAVDGLAPRQLVVEGTVEVLEGVRGYGARPGPAGQAELVSDDPPRLRAGETMVVGFVRGREIRVDAMAVEDVRRRPGG